MTQCRSRRFVFIAAIFLLASCQPAALSQDATTADLAEFYGSGRLQLADAASTALTEFLNTGRQGLFAASRRNADHARRFCRSDGCSADDARQVIDECNRRAVIGYRACGLLVAGRQVVWRGRVVDPRRQLAVLEDHNRRVVQALVFEFQGRPEAMVATVYIDEMHPIGLFTIEAAGSGGFCQGAYDLLSPEASTWDLRCDTGLEASGTFLSEDLTRGGTGIGTDSQNGEVRLTLLPRS